MHQHGKGSWALAGIGVFVVIGVGLVLASVFWPRPSPAPTPSPMRPPTSSIDRVTLQEGFREYLEANVAVTEPGEVPFCTWDLLGSADVESGADAYVWAHCESYAVFDDHAQRGRMTVVPVVLHVRESDETMGVASHEAPSTDDSYESDVRRLFPDSLHGAVLGPGAVGPFPTVPRVRALEDLGVPVRTVGPVGVAQPQPPLRLVHEGRHMDAFDWSLEWARATAEPSGAAECFRYRADPPDPPPPDVPVLGHEVCVPGLGADIHVRKVAEALVTETDFAWAFGQAARDVDEVEGTFTDQSRQTFPVRNGVWTATYDAVRYMSGMIARSGGRTVGGCGIEGYRSC